ncbi:hypothetical protein BgiMline_029641, partial [Biomphalaria glabrata]
QAKDKTRSSDDTSGCKTSGIRDYCPPLHSALSWSGEGKDQLSLELCGVNDCSVGSMKVRGYK